LFVSANSSLDLSYNKDITDDGILYLCGDSRTYGRCLKITSLNVKGTSVNHLGIFTVLLKLTDLEDLFVTSDKLLLNVLLQFLDIYKGTKKLQLKSLKFDDRDSYFVTQNIENICKILPNVSDVDSVIDDLTPLYSLPKINTLSLYTDASSLDVGNLIAHLGFNLIDLSIQESYCTVDLSLIGHCCPNIKKISLSALTILQTINAYEILPCSFQKLEHLNMQPEGEESMPSQVFTKMLASKFLACLDLWTLPEEILLASLSQARENNTEIFSNLDKIDLGYSDMSFESWVELLCAAPNLKSVSIMDSEDADVCKKVHKFIVRNNFNINFSL
jgi:hypothetical protein